MAWVCYVILSSILCSVFAAVSFKHFDFELTWVTYTCCISRDSRKFFQIFGIQFSQIFWIDSICIFLPFIIAFSGFLYRSYGGSFQRLQTLTHQQASKHNAQCSPESQEHAHTALHMSEEAEGLLTLTLAELHVLVLTSFIKLIKILPNLIKLLPKHIMVW